MCIASLISKRVPLHSSGPSTYYAFIQLMIYNEAKSAMRIYPHAVCEGLNKFSFINYMFIQGIVERHASANLKENR